MKKLSLFIALALFTALTAHADNYVIKFRGTIISSTGRVRVTEADLVRTNGNILVYQIDTAAKEFNIVESDSTGVENFGEQAHSDDAAVNSSGRVFATDLHDGDGFADNVGSLPVFDGRLFGTGRIALAGGTPKSFRMTVNGIWNVDDNSVFKGVITGRRLP